MSELLCAIPAPASHTKPKQSMKKILIPIIALCVSTAFAADVKVTKTTQDTKGTVTEYEPGKTLTIKEDAGPQSYHWTKTVTYVDSGGKTLTEEQARARIKVGKILGIQYVVDGTRRIIHRVVVND